MNLKAKFESVKLPQALAELKHANQFLKVFSLSSAVLNLLCLGLVIILVSKGPKVIALAPTGEVLSEDAKPNAEKEVKAALKRYIEFRYSWASRNVRERLLMAREFVHKDALKSFDSELSEVQKFSKERNVSQRGYASELSVDLTKQIAKVRGDRVTTIQGLTAAGALTLTLYFESGPRTKANPWGIYIVREKNE